MSPGQDLIDKAEEGLGSGILAMILSPASCAVRWPRDRWEPVLRTQAKEAGVEVVSILLEDCPYPPLLERRGFFDARDGRLAAMRALKRWIRSRTINRQFSDDLEDLYRRLADTAGSLDTEGIIAGRFAHEARHDFDAVLWVACAGRSLAQAAGDLAAQLGLRLDGTARENGARLREFLGKKRCLLVLDAPSAEIATELKPAGRTSILRTREAVRSVAAAPRSVAQARALVAAGRFAEAYEMFYALIDDWVDTETCARELTWICEHWDRVDEADALRVQYGHSAGEQLRLF